MLRLTKCSSPFSDHLTGSARDLPLPSKLESGYHTVYYHSGIAHRYSGVMAALGFSINTLTLFGLILAVAIVVDDAIVVVENASRLLETGQYLPVTQ